ncbi:hypothetical protein PFY10_19800 [Chryseobacterium daecheongense]|nr:hypothetical protein PFY10_19800 [Chryseobacterium daecheongense]
MKSVRKIASHPIILGTLLASFLNMSCSQGDTRDNQSIEIKSQKNSNNFSKIASLSDVDVFKGVMFFEGDIANSLADFKELNFRNFITDNTKIAEIEAFQNNVVQNIEVSNPGYMEKFRTDISSGDYYKVEAAIRDAAQLVRKETIALAQTNDATATELTNLYATQVKEQSDISSSTSVPEVASKARQIKIQAGDTVWFDTDTVVWAVVAVAGAVVVVGAVAVFLYAPQTGMDTPYLQEKFTSDVTMQLKGI